MAINQIFGSSSATSNFINSSLGINSASNANSGNQSIVSDYMSIKNGSYYKLLKAYYASDSKGSEESEADSAQKAQNKKIASDASNLSKASANALATDFRTADEDSIVSVIKAFADAYNDTIHASSEENSTQKDVLRNTVWMTNLTSSSEKLLSSVGITVKSDNTLSINEEALKSANRGTLETLFHGNLSFASKVSAKASSIYKAALGDKATGSAYTSTGKSYQAVSSPSKIDSLT